MQFKILVNRKIFNLTFRKSESDNRGHIHVRTVSAQQKFGRPVAGNYFYLDMAAGNLQNQNIGHRYV